MCTTVHRLTYTTQLHILELPFQVMGFLKSKYCLCRIFLRITFPICDWRKWWTRTQVQSWQNFEDPFSSSVINFYHVQRICEIVRADSPGLFERRTSKKSNCWCNIKVSTQGIKWFSAPPNTSMFLCLQKIP